MNYVQPIWDKKKIQTMKTVLKAKDEKYYIMFLIGINVGFGYLIYPHTEGIGYKGQDAY